jgi:hypothetical protein
MGLELGGRDGVGAWWQGWGWSLVAGLIRGLSFNILIDNCTDLCFLCRVRFQSFLLSFSPSLLPPVQTEEQRVQQQQSQETRLAELEGLLQVLATKTEVTSITEKYTQYPITYISQYIQEHTGPGS